MSSGLTKKDTMFSGSNQTPWHGLGEVIEGRADANRALQLAKLDWEATCEPIFTADMAEITGHKALTRSDDKSVLGIVGNKYQPLQNRYLAEIAESVVSTGEACFETGGSLFGGLLVWFLLRIGERKLADGNEHRTYLLASNGHAGKAKARLGLVDTRVVCWNTYSAAVREGGQHFAVRHTKNLLPKMEQGIEMLKWAHEGTNALFRSYEMLLDKSMSLDEANRILREVIVPEETDETYDLIIEKYRNGPGNSGETAFDLFNGITDWLDHADVKDLRSAEHRFTKAVLAEDAAIKRHAMSVLLNA